jgi:MFS family permease
MASKNCLERLERVLYTVRICVFLRNAMLKELKAYRKRKYLLYLCAFLMDFALGVYLVIAPIMADRLTDNSIVLGSTGLIFLGARIFLQLAFGKLSDFVGRKPLILLSFVVFTAATLMLPVAGGIELLLVSFLLAGASNALLWPILEAWVGDDVHGANLIRSIGAFNMAFSFGLAVGALTAGYLEMIRPIIAVALAVFLTAVSFVLVLSRPSYSPRKLRELSSAEDHGISARRHPIFLKIAWIANFLGWGGVGVMRFLFVELSDSLHFSSGQFGRMLFSFYFSMFVLFVLLRRFHFWQYRLVPLLSAQLVGVIGFSLVGLSGSETVLCVGLSLFGMSLGITYFSSIYYGLDGHVDKGTKSGMHETLLALGMAAPVLVGSTLAEHVSLRAPYFLVSGSILIGMIVETILVLKSGWSRAA